MKLFNCPVNEKNALFGQIFLDYNRFFQKTSTNAIGAVAGVTPNSSKVTVSQLGVIVAPKYQFGLGNFKLWRICKLKDLRYFHCRRGSII